MVVGASGQLDEKRPRAQPTNDIARCHLRGAVRLTHGGERPRRRERGFRHWGGWLVVDARQGRRWR